MSRSSYDALLSSLMCLKRNTNTEILGIEFLYHVKRTITEYDEDKSGATRIVDILGTFTQLPAAKQAAYSALASEGYLRDDFEKYEVKSEVEVSPLSRSLCPESPRYPKLPRKFCSPL